MSQLDVQFFAVPALAMLLRAVGLLIRQQLSSRFFELSLGRLRAQVSGNNYSKPLVTILAPVRSARDVPTPWRFQAYDITATDITLTVSMVWMVAVHVRAESWPDSSVVVFFIVGAMLYVCHHALLAGRNQIHRELFLALFIGLSVVTLVVSVGWARSLATDLATDSGILENEAALSGLVGDDEVVTANRSARTVSLPSLLGTATEWNASSSIHEIPAGHQSSPALRLEGT